jgi:hypothetical protein
MSTMVGVKLLTSGAILSVPAASVHGFFAEEIALKCLLRAKYDSQRALHLLEEECAVDVNQVQALLDDHQIWTNGEIDQFASIVQKQSINLPKAQRLLKKPMKKIVSLHYRMLRDDSPFLRQEKGRQQKKTCYFCGLQGGYAIRCLSDIRCRHAICKSCCAVSCCTCMK